MKNQLAWAKEYFKKVEALRKEGGAFVYNFDLYKLAKAIIADAEEAE